MNSLEERFERAYVIDSKVYRGQEISDEDQAFVVSVIKEIWETDNPPIGVGLWATFAAKDYNVT